MFDVSISPRDSILDATVSSGTGPDQEGPRWAAVSIEVSMCKTVQGTSTGRSRRVMKDQLSIRCANANDLFIPPHHSIFGPIIENRQMDLMPLNCVM